MHVHRLIHAWIAARLVGTDTDEITVLIVYGVELLEALRRLLMFLADDVIHDAADGGLDVNGRVMPGFGNRTRQHDVTVENGARCVGDGVVLVIPFRQYGIEGRDGTTTHITVARPLHQLRQPGEHRGWIALGGRWLADGQGDLALGLGATGQRIHQQQYILALVAEMLGDAGGHHGAVQAHQRRVVRRRGHHHGTRQALGTENVIDEFLYFATTFADQPHHDHIGVGVLGHHAQQHTLAHATAGEQAHALAATDTEQGIDGTHPYIKGLAHRLATERIDAAAGERHMGLDLQRALAVEGIAGAVQHPAQQGRAGGRLADTMGGDHPGIGHQALQIADGHEKEFLAGKTHHLGLDGRALGRADHAASTDGGLDTHRLQGQAHHARQAAFDQQRRRETSPVEIRLQALLPQDTAAGFRYRARVHPEKLIPATEEHGRHGNKTSS